MIPISACLIVRNEGRRLDAALTSLRQLPGLAEIVVLDTGSTDDTLAIAERHGARMHHDPWQDDFALHRNRCHDLARHDWIFKLDGDEEVIDPGEVDWALAQAEVDGVAYEVDCWAPMGFSASVVQSRLYDRRKGRWKYAIHEQLLGLDRIASAGGTVRAWYDHGEGPEQQRRLAVMQRWREREPAEAHWLVGLAQAARARADWPEVLRWTEVGLRDGLRDGHGPMLAFWRAQALLLLDRPAEAASLVRAELAQAPDYMDLLHLDLGFRMVTWQRAIAAARRVAPGLPCESADIELRIDAAMQSLGLPLRFSPLAQDRNRPNPLQPKP